MDCKRCSSPRLIKRGGYGTAGQRYKCKACKRTFVTGGARPYFDYVTKKHIVMKSYTYGNLSKMCRVWHISPKTLYKWRRRINKQEQKILNSTIFSYR